MTVPLLRALERFLLPNACLACNGSVEPHLPDTLVCGVCRSRLRSVTGGCERCHQPLPPIGPCRFCNDWPEELGSVSSAVWLDDRARSLVHALKYRGFRRLGSDLAALIARRVRRPRRGWLVPIPLGPRRLRERGYNQAAALARGLGERWQLPVAERVLMRAKETPSQTELTPEERAANIAGAFAAAPPRGQGWQQEQEWQQGQEWQQAAERDTSATSASISPGSYAPAVILVDDVLTTGATLSAATRALVSAGWSAVAAVTFARALPYEQRIEWHDDRS